MHSTEGPRKEPPTSSHPGPAVPSFERLVLETSSDLYRLATRMTGSTAEADDVLQTAYLRAFEALRAGTFRGECQLTTWLYRIVTHAAFDARRLERRRDSLVQAAPKDGVANSTGVASVELGELREALATLPEDQRTAVALKELHGLSAKETAEVMERTEGAVEQLLVRARASLRKRFES